MSAKPIERSFADHLSAILNGGALTAAIAIGYRTGLFDAMERLAALSTAPAIAREARIDERYAREWLNAMGCGGIVEMARDDRGEVVYHLPPDHAAHLTRTAGTGNLAVYTQEIPLLTRTAMEAVVDAFRTGAGIPYADYPEFQAFMAELADAKHRRVLVDAFLPSVDGGRLIERLRQGIRVCDLGCGAGVAAVLMARAFPESRFIGIDTDAEAVRRARETAGASSLSNAVFEVADAAAIGSHPDYRGAFDYVTAFDAIHDQTAPLDALKSIRSMLAAGGLFSMIDIAAHSDPIQNAAHPMAPFLYTVSLLHCLPVGRVDGGMGLGMMWGREKAVELLEAAGFANVEVNKIPEDPFNLHFLCRAPV